MSNADFLATAFVQIRPKTTGFQKELRDQIQKAVAPIKNTTVLVSPSTTGFTNKLRTQVKDAISKAGAFPVPVTPTLTAFRAQLAKQLSDKPIPVTVAPTGKASTGAKASASAEAELTASQTARKEITDLLRESERLLKESTKDGLSIKEKDAIVTQSQAKAREALTRVTEGQLSGERALVEARLKNRALVQEAKTGRASSAVAGEKEQFEAEKKASAEAAAQKEALRKTEEGLAQTGDRLINVRSRLNETIKSSLAPSEKLKLIDEDLTKVSRIRMDLNDQLVGSIRRNEKEQSKLIDTTFQDARATEEALRSKKNLLETSITSGKLAETEADLRGRIADAFVVEETSLTSLDAVRKQDQTLKKIGTDLTKLETTATKAGATATAEFAAAQKIEVQTRRDKLVEQNRNIKANLKEATSQKNLARGAGATFLARLGARGATLAAGSEFLAGAAAVTLFAKAVDSAASLEQELNVFRITARATGEEMDQVSEEALKLGADITLPGVAAGDAAIAFTSLAKAGLDVQDSLGGARGVLQLATAAQITNAEATELVASALNAFNLAGVEATHVADLLTGAANEAQGSISDMGIALQQSSAVARQAGLSLEDTVAFITLLARAGIRGSDAGTSLRTALLRLIAPTEQAQEILENLGITILNAQGAVRPEAFSELQDALSGLNATARNQILRKIFGQDAIRAAVIFGREGVKGLNEVRDATNQAGLAAELATARTQGFSGQVEALKNNLSTLGVTLGEVTLGPLTIFIKQTNRAVGFVNEITGGLKNLARTISNLKLPPIEIDFEAGPVKVKAEEDGFEIGAAIRRGVKAGIVGTEELLISQIPGATQANRAAILIRALRQVEGNAQDAAREIEDLFQNFREAGGGPSSLNELVLALQKMIDRLKGGDAEAQRLAERIQSIIDNLVVVEALPPINVPILLEEPEFPPLKGPVITFPTRTIVDKAKSTMKDAGTSGLQVMEQIFSGPAGEAVANIFFEGFFKGTKKKIPEIREAIALGFDMRLAVAEAQGASDAEILAILREREAKQRAFLDRQLARPQDAKQQDLTERAAGQLNETVSAIEAITDRQASEAKEKADDIEKKQKEASDAVLRLFSANEQKILNRQTVAAQTEGLRDDVAAGEALLALYIKQAAVASKKLKDKEALRDFMREINQKIFDVTIQIAQDQKALNASIRQQAREDRERIITGIELDIELAEINENRNREIALRRKLIKALEDQIKHEKGNTNRIKELRNEIARQKQAIKEAQGEAEERSGAFRRLTFEFLQAQQGFASNLLGNLIPLGNVAGLVGNLQIGPGAGGGGGSTLGGPPAGFGPTLGIGKGPDGLPILTGGGGAGGISTAMATAGADGGPPPPTRGQSSTQIDLLRRIAKLLEDIKSGDMAPEAKKAKKLGGSAMDVAQ